MDPPALWKDYFDNPTFSDLTIRLSDKVVHVYRIVLCRGSEYFEKLLTKGFKESGASEVSLHEDDPRTAVELLRFIYGLGYDQSHMDSMGSMQFLAATYVTAAKYQLVGLQDKTKDDMRRFVTMEMIRCWEPSQIDDFLAATEIIFAGTTQEDEMRKLMVDYCFWNLPFLTDKVARFPALLADNAGLGFEIFTRFNLHLSPYDGSWYCGDQIGKWHPDARPSCRECGEPFSKRYTRLHRSEVEWKCRECYHEDLTLFLYGGCGAQRTEEIDDCEHFEKYDQVLLSMC